MVSPVYALEQWLANLFGVTTELPVLAFIFALFLIFEPLLLIGVAAWITRSVGRQQTPLFRSRFVMHIRWFRSASASGWPTTAFTF
jgi:flagellar biogenesis protein FliO